MEAKKNSSDVVAIKLQLHSSDVMKWQRVAAGVRTRPTSKSATARERVSQLVVLCRRFLVTISQMMVAFPTMITTAITERIAQYQ